jgi:hypothetical protein
VGNLAINEGSGRAAAVGPIDRDARLACIGLRAVSRFPVEYTFPTRRSEREPDNAE